MAELRQYDIAGAAMQGFQQGRAIRNQNQLNQLAAQAYSTPQEGQNALLGQIAQISPQAAQAQQQQFQQGEDRTASQLRGLVQYVNKARATNDPRQVNAALASAGPFIQRLTGKAPPTEWTPDMDAGWAQLEAQVAMQGGSSAAGGGVQSTYVDGDGNRVAIMRDGSTQTLGRNDAGATQQTISITGPDGRPAQYTFDRRTGNYVPAGAGMAAQPAAQAPTFAQGQGQQAIEQIAASANAMIAQGIPEAQVEAWAASQLGGGQISDGVPSGNQLRTTQTVVGSPTQFVGQSPAEKAEAEARARAGVEIDTAPILQDIKLQGDINRMRATREVEGLPTQAVQQIEEAQDAIDIAGGIQRRLAGHASRIDQGQLELGPVANRLSEARNFAGQSNQQSRNYQSFRDDIEKLRNDSLRLNKGVQTEGDAQRALNEIFGNLTDTAYVRQRIDELQRINQRAAQLQQERIHRLRQNYSGGQRQPAQNQNSDIDSLLDLYR